MPDPEDRKEKQETKLRFSQEQYDMLKRCSDKKDMTEWNEWRKKNPDEEVLLEGADLYCFYLVGAYLNKGMIEDSEGTKHIFNGKVHLKGGCLMGAEMKKAELMEADISRAVLTGADLEGAYLAYAHLEGTELNSACLNKAYIFGAHMENANLSFAKLKGAILQFIHLERATLIEAWMNETNLAGAHLEGVRLQDTHLEGAGLYNVHLEDAMCFRVIVSGSTRIWECHVNRYRKDGDYTDFSGVALNSAQVDPGTKQLLEYNVRRMNWEEWYPKQHRLLAWPVRKFWQISDYGISTQGIIRTFFKWAFVFAIAYYVWGCIDYYLLSNKDYPGIVSNLFVLEDSKQEVSGWLIPLRAIYFSIVTMTTLGFGDMYANAHSLFRGIFGHILLAFQVILGYVLLGALVTRFAVLFTAGGPAGKFADEKEKEDKKK